MKKIKLFFTVLALAISALAFAQNITVSGVVTDSATGDAVPFASLQIKGTMTGANTDADGNYSISAPADGVLVFSSVGYASQEVEVNARGVINVALTPDTVLDDVIVVAYGTTTKEAFTGSAKVIDSEELAKSQVSTVTAALAGQVAGVQVSTSGAPGSSPSIRIRGFSSISAGKEPLYIVDGMPYDGDLNNINPTDVESMTVLKDAASNALYGARGANGVIMITTKSAKKRDATVTFDMKLGMNNKALRAYDTIHDPAMYYELHYAALNDYFLHTGMSPEDANLNANAAIPGASSAGGLGYMVYTVPEGQRFIGLNGKINPNATLGNIVNYKGQDYLLTPDDWTKVGYRNTLRQEYNLSVAGGDEKSHFFASLGYLDNKGITANSDMTRLTARLKGDYQAKKWLKISANMAYAGFNYNSLSDDGSSNSTGNIWAFTNGMAPIYPLYVRDGEGNPMVDANGITMMDYGDGMNAGLTRAFINNANPILANQLNTNNAKGNAFSVNGAADINFYKDLKLTINGGLNLDETRGTDVLNPYYGQFASSGGTVGKSHSRVLSWNSQQILNYTHAFGKHNVNVMLGHEYYDYTYAALSASKQNMFSQANKELAGAVVDNQSAYSYTSEYNNEGIFARAQYDFDSKIFLSASYRRDASSRFAPEYRWGNFWSAGAAWILSKESWFNASWVDNLKLKASVGSQGNDNIGSYLYTDTFSIVPSDGEVSVMFDQKGKRDITWETNTNVNAGVEFGFLNNRIEGSVEYFYRMTSDMLFAFSVAPSMGYTSYYDNVGDMYNQGVELNLNFNILQKKDIEWSINLNATHVQNKITYLHDDVKTKTMDGHDGYNSGSYFIGENLPLYTRYLKSYAGVYNENTYQLCGEGAEYDPTLAGQSMWWKNNVEYFTDDELGAMSEEEKAALKQDGEKFIKKESKDAVTDYSKADYYLGKGPIPDLYGGFGTSFYCHGFDFSINFSYQIGGMAYDSGYASFMGTPNSGSTGSNFHVDVLNAWSEDNPNSNIPIWRYDDKNSASSSDRFLTDASYLNIENINIGYTFPSKWTSKIKLESLRIYAACENVWYWSRRNGFDPRYSFTGATNYSTYVPIRTFSGGLTVKF